MQSMQRRFGKFLPRSADETQVAVLLNDFEEADKMLTKVCYIVIYTHMNLEADFPRSLTRRKHGGILGGIYWVHSKDSPTVSKHSILQSLGPTRIMRDTSL